MSTMVKKGMDYLPGIMFTLIIALLSEETAAWIKAYIKLEPLVIAIAISIIYANTIGIHKKLLPGIKFTSKELLKVGIILLGVRLDFGQVLKLGPKILMIVLVIAVVGQLLPMLLAKVFGLNNRLATLLGVGSSICGTSAVVAMGPVIKAEKEDTTIAAAVISVLGALGVLAYTLLMNVLPMTKLQYGIWAGSTLQGVAHAVGAAQAGGMEAFSIGTVVKMSRVVLLAPLALILGYIYNREKTEERVKIHFPMYILGFIALGIIKTFGIIPTNMIPWLSKASSYLILMAMLGLGLEVSLKEMQEKGLKALALCTLIFMVISAVGLGMIFWLRI